VRTRYSTPDIDCHTLDVKKGGGASIIYATVHVCTRGTGDLGSFANWAPTRASRKDQGVRSASQIRRRGPDLHRFPGVGNWWGIQQESLDRPAHGPRVGNPFPSQSIFYLLFLWNGMECGTPTGSEKWGGEKGKRWGAWRSSGSGWSGLGPTRRERLALNGWVCECVCTVFGGGWLDGMAR
jgi:hypothetical protein